MLCGLFGIVHIFDDEVVGDYIIIRLWRLDERCAVKFIGEDIARNKICLIELAVVGEIKLLQAPVVLYPGHGKPFKTAELRKYRKSLERIRLYPLKEQKREK